MAFVIHLQHDFLYSVIRYTCLFCVLFLIKLYASSKFNTVTETLLCPRQGLREYKVKKIRSISSIFKELTFEET